jgi:hydrogenase expression/formation protein HypC
MCLGVPMKILEVRDLESGTVELEGVAYTVNLSLLEDPKPGEYVIVHAGFAIERLDQDEADRRIALFQELAASVAETK